MHKYHTTLEIESSTLEELCMNFVLPAAMDYQTRLASNKVQMKEAGFDNKHVEFSTDTIKRISKNINAIHGLIEEMHKARLQAHKEADSLKAALIYCHEVKPVMDQIRLHADDLELTVDDRDWALVKYREMMYIR